VFSRTSELPSNRVRSHQKLTHSARGHNCKNWQARFFRKPNRPSNQARDIGRYRDGKGPELGDDPGPQNMQTRRNSAQCDAKAKPAQLVVLTGGPSP
jgi:hypothetical protein